MKCEYFKQLNVLDFHRRLDLRAPGQTWQIASHKNEILFLYFNTFTSQMNQFVYRKHYVFEVMLNMS